jgi:hypothetical protein
LLILAVYSVKMTNKPSDTSFISSVIELLQLARQRFVNVVNHTMVLTYYEIGRKIVEEEQNGRERADYGKHLMKELSSELTKEFGKGFSRRNLEQMRQFYQVYSKPQTLSAL